MFISSLAECHLNQIWLTERWKESRTTICEVSRETKASLRSALYVTLVTYILCADYIDVIIDINSHIIVQLLVVMYLVSDTNTHILYI